MASSDKPSYNVKTVWQQVKSYPNFLFISCDKKIYIIDTDKCSIYASNTPVTDSKSNDNKESPNLWQLLHEEDVQISLEHESLYLKVKDGKNSKPVCFNSLDDSTLLKKMLFTIEELCARQKLLIQELQKKDMELEDYRDQQGLQLHRRYLRTDDFRADTFQQLTHHNFGNLSLCRQFLCMFSIPASELNCSQSTKSELTNRGIPVRKYKTMPDNCSSIEPLTLPSIELIKERRDKLKSLMCTKLDVSPNKKRKRL
ncbi:hypothetical protein GJ496_000028 [Pomphorhynchus laevis]|nr:hypothetical protein GJ496_000028 [Pomphorhynchus laevis]